MNRRFLLLPLLVALQIWSSDGFTVDGSNNGGNPMVYVQLNNTAEIALPVSANYRRTVLNEKSVSEEHLYRVCTAKNKKTCGYWENVKTKKKVASGPTTYNKNKKLLIVKRIRQTDYGTYMTGNKKKSVEVMKLNIKG